MCHSNDSQAVSCVDNGHGRCVAEGHHNGQHYIDPNGQCKVGRSLQRQADQLRAQMVECPVCKTLVPKNTGLVFDFRVFKTGKFNNDPNLAAAFLRMIEKDYSTTSPICACCADEVNMAGQVAFVALAVLVEAVATFVRNFLAGGFVYHRHDEIDGHMRNWCDHCGRFVPLEDEDRMGGVIRNNIAVCLCPDCDERAHEVIPDLPQTSYFDALEKVMGRPVIRTKPGFLKLVRTSEPANAATPAAKPIPPKFESVLDVYNAIMAGKRINFGREIEGKLTRCVVHANTEGFCENPLGAANWADMKAVRRGDQAFGFCPECDTELVAAGIVLERSLQEIIVVDIQGGTLRQSRPVDQTPRFDQYRRVDMEFNNTLAARPNRKPQDRVTASDKIKADARRAFEAALADLDRQIAARQVDLDKLSRGIKAKQDEIASMANEGDQEFKALVISCANDVLAELQPKCNEVAAEVDRLTRERKAVEAAGPKAFRVTPKSRPAEPDKKKGKGEKGKGKGKKGENHAAA